MIECLISLIIWCIVAAIILYIVEAVLGSFLPIPAQVLMLIRFVGGAAGALGGSRLFWSLGRRGALPVQEVRWLTRERYRLDPVPPEQGLMSARPRDESWTYMLDPGAGVAVVLNPHTLDMQTDICTKCGASLEEVTGNILNRNYECRVHVRYGRP